MSKAQRFTELKQKKSGRSFLWLGASVLLLGSGLAGLPALAADVTLDAGPGIQWNPSAVSLKKGDVLSVRQADPKRDHGLVFTGTGAPKKPIPRCDANPPTGTVLCEETKGASSGYDKPISADQGGEFLRLKALQDLPVDMPFQCVVHGTEMTGTVKK
jgi:hypothetical protein